MQFFYFIFFILSISAFADTEYELSPIIREGTPGDVFMVDPVIPTEEGRTFLNSGTGSIQTSVQDQVALPMTDVGRPGGIAQVRGLGVSAEDVDVQAFGISLNPPQGGGFDLSIFPQYLWTGFQYQMGPTLNGLNATSSTGTFSLIPWTYQVLVDRNASQMSWRGHGTEFYSDLGVNQVSAAAHVKDQFAGVAGYSSGRLKGPSAALGTRWGNTAYRGSAQLLVTDVEAEAPGSTEFRTPNATQRSRRWIPILLNDFQVGKEGLLKTSLYYDYYDIDYKNPDPTPTYWNGHTRQWGLQLGYIVSDWRIGVNAKQIHFFTEGSFQSVDPPQQILGNLQLSRTIQLGSFLVDPIFQGIWVSGIGFLPQGSLGGRYPWDQGKKAVFSRVLLSRRVPSLLDRYGSYGNFVGNPDLKTELDWTGILGMEWTERKWEASIQGYVQLRENARVTTFQTVYNADNAWVAALLGKGQVSLNSHFDLFNSFTLSRSRLGMTGEDFPYVPTILNVFGYKFHSKRGLRSSFSWEWMTAWRTSSSRIYQVGQSTPLPGYGVIDSNLQFQFFERFSLGGRVENIFNRTYELIQGYPIGRSASVLLVAEL